MPTETANENRFEGLPLATLREMRDKVGAEWSQTASTEIHKATANGDASIARFSPEATEAIVRYKAEYQAITDTIQMAEAKDSRDNLNKARENMLENAPNASYIQAKLDAETYEKVLKVGKNKYQAETLEHSIATHLGEVNLGQALIARNKNSGKNEVLPVPPVFRGQNGSADIEASFRLQNIVADDKLGQYDAATGMKVDGHMAPVGRERRDRIHAVVTNPADPASGRTATWDLTTMGGDIYLFMIQRNNFLQWCKVIQTDAINDYLIDRRLTVPTAPRVTQDGTIGMTDSTFNTLTLRAYKYGSIFQYTNETLMQQEPWSAAAIMSYDAGISLANGIGEDLITGQGTTATPDEPMGILTFVKASGAPNSSTRVDVDIANAAFVKTASPQPGISQFSRFMGGLPKEYFLSLSKMLLMRLSSWTGLQGITDGENRKLYDSNSSIGDLSMPMFNVGVLLDENMDEGVATGEVPIIYGDMQAYCARLAGPPRLDYSTEFGFQNDRFSLRFLQHADGNVVDWNAIRGLVLD